MEKKLFKKIYVEITNRCNLSCSFCGKSKRKFKDMSVKEFEEVIYKIKDYTDYIYLHVKGEPLLYDNLDSILSVCEVNNIKVNITTNGVLLKNRMDVLMNHSCIRQINVSLHCENNKKDYFEEVFLCCKELSTKMFISYRIWNLDEFKLDDKSTDIVNKIILSYNLSTEVVQKLYNDVQIKISENTFVNKENLFVWPDVENSLSIDGHCYGLSTHIGILSDGTVIPCCLDGNGEINLGNIFVNNLEEIMNSFKYVKLKEGFKNNKSLHELCKNCNFRNRFLKK